MVIPLQRAATPPGKQIVQALRVEPKCPCCRVALLTNGITIGCVARLASRAFGLNAIPGNKCEQILIGMHS